MAVEKSQRRPDEEIEEYMDRVDKTLRSDGDFSATLDLEDFSGSKFHIVSVYVEEDETYLYVFTEHYGCLFFEKEILEKWGIEE